MLVYIYDREEEELRERNEHREHAYVYEYDDNYEYEEEDSTKETNDYEVDYEINEDLYLISWNSVNIFLKELLKYNRRL